MCHPSWTRALTAARRPGDLAWLHRVRDRIDGEYAQLLDVEALARGAHVSAGHSTRFTELAGVPPSAHRREAADATEGMPSCAAKQVTRPVRDRAALATEPQLA